jgi:hypothetical protein
MTRRSALGSFAIVIALTVLTAWVSAQTQPGSFKQHTIDFVNLLKLVGGVFGMIGIGWGFLIYARAVKVTKTNEALKEALDSERERAISFKARIESLEERAQIFVEDHHRVQQAVIEKDKEIAELRARTDLSRVVESQNELLTMKREHDAQMMKVFQDAVATGGSQYVQVMDVLAKLLAHLDETAKNNLAQTGKNHELILGLSRSVENLSRRFGTVEGKVQEVADAVDSGTPKPDDRRQSKKGPGTDGERRTQER